MNKGDLIKVIADAAGITKTEATNALNAVVDSITNSLKAGDKVTLVGFGTFSVVTRPARSGRNPSTGATIQIPAKKQIKFKPGKEMDASVNS